MWRNSDNGRKVTGFERSAFIDCTNLKRITIPDSIVRIVGFNYNYTTFALTGYYDTFTGCDNLEEINVAEDNPVFSSVDGVLYNKDKTKLIRVPNAANKVVIPTTVERIDKYAFELCNSNVTIYGEAGSYAEKYAKIYGMDFVQGMPSDVKPGDTNGDGETDIKDSAVLKRYLAGWEVELDEEAADVDGDGKVTIKDSALVKRQLAGWE